jgi:ribonuclease P protein component
MAGKRGFPKEERLRKRREFLQVQGQGFKVTAEPLLALALPNGRDFTRLGLTVSTKVGNAVVRTRLRRKLRELFRARKQELPKGLDVVLIARTTAAQASFEQLTRAFEGVAQKLGVRFGATAVRVPPVRAL